MKKRSLLFLIIFTLMMGFGQAQTIKNDTTALLLIDIQDFYFPGGFYPLVEPEAAAEQASRLLHYFRKEHMLVVHVKHAASKDTLIRALVAPQVGETVITKHYANAFRKTNLLKVLTQHHIKQVVVCGMMTQMCVEATARAAADLGFDLIVIGDACATRDLVYEGDTIKARDVHLSTLASLKGYYGKVLSTDEYLKEIP